MPAASSASLATRLSTWVVKRYVAAGRLRITAANSDSAGAPGVLTYDFEAASLSEPIVIGDPGVVPGATLTREATTAHSGDGALKINTTAVPNQGIVLDLPGTFGTAYGAAAWFKGTAGDSVRLVMQRADGSGTPDSTAITSTGSWQRIAVNWGGLGSGRAQLAFIANNAQAAAHSVYLDEVSVWRTSDPSVGAPTTTEYDAAGRVVASIARQASRQIRLRLRWSPPACTTR